MAFKTTNSKPLFSQDRSVRYELNQLGLDSNEINKIKKRFNLHDPIIIPRYRGFDSSLYLFAISERRFSQIRLIPLYYYNGRLYLIKEFNCIKENKKFIKGKINEKEHSEIIDEIQWLIDLNLMPLKW
ncbi:MAG: hypothetical protein WC150_15110 [Bacteroidia bacterium]